MIPSFTRAYEASAAVSGFRLAAFNAPAGASTVAHAAGGTTALLGAFDRQGAPAGGMADVHRLGLVSVQLAGTVAAGDPVTSDAAGLGIKAVPGAGANLNIVGFADQPGVAGDIIDVFMSPGLVRG